MENAPSFFGLRRVSYHGTVCGDSEIIFGDSALRVDSPYIFLL